METLTLISACHGLRYRGNHFFVYGLYPLLLHSVTTLYSTLLIQLSADKTSTAYRLQSLGGNVLHLFFFLVLATFRKIGFALEWKLGYCGPKLPLNT